MYRLFTGQLPIRGETFAEILAKQLTMTPEPPSALAAIPPALDRLIMRCLEKDADARPQSAAQLSQALCEIFGLPDMSGPQAVWVPSAVALGETLNMPGPRRAQGRDEVRAARAGTRTALGGLGRGLGADASGEDRVGHRVCRRGRRGGRGGCLVRVARGTARRRRRDGRASDDARAGGRPGDGFVTGGAGRGAPERGPRPPRRGRDAEPCPKPARARPPRRPRPRDRPRRGVLPPRAPRRRRQRRRKARTTARRPPGW